jgi:SAM-dependent methyltransferase
VHQPRPRHIHRAGVAALDRLDLLARWLPRQSTGTRLLDVGAGGGEFVYLARRRGYDARGIEPNVGYSEFAQSAYGVEVRTAGLEAAGDTHADVVTMFHVFEHMAHPRDALTRIAGILSPGGHLFIEVPNILQADASPHNTYFRAHLYYYSRHTLAAAASRHFDLLEVDDQGNLKALLRKKAQPEAACRLPGADELAFIRARLARKGWLEYLTVGGGLRKPFLRVATRMRERSASALAGGAAGAPGGGGAPPPPGRLSVNGCLEARGSGPAGILDSTETQGGAWLLMISMSRRYGFSWRWQAAPRATLAGQRSDHAKPTAHENLPRSHPGCPAVPRPRPCAGRLLLGR